MKHLVYLTSQPGLGEFRLACSEIARAQGYKIVSVPLSLNGWEKPKSWIPGSLAPDNVVQDFIAEAMCGDWEFALIEGAPATLNQSVGLVKESFMAGEVHKSTFHISFSQGSKALDNLIYSLGSTNADIARRRMTFYEHHADGIERHLRRITAFSVITADFAKGHAVNSFTKGLRMERGKLGLGGTQESHRIKTFQTAIA